jgi:hypothetical protein
VLGNRREAAHTGVKDFETFEREAPEVSSA